MNVGDGHTGQRVTLTILFLDIVDSTKLFSAYDDEEVNGLLKSFLKDASSVVGAYEGLVNQTMGDGLMAVFGLAGTHEKHALMACQAAEELQRLFLNVGLRIGIHTGGVIVERNEISQDPIYRIVGESVHIAAKLEKAAAPRMTLISRETYDLVIDQVIAKPHARHKIGDRLEPVESFQFLSVLKKTMSGKRPEFFRSSPFSGRQNELEALMRGLRHAIAGERQVALVSGAPGFGKSRLIYEFLEQARSHHPDLFVASFAFPPTGVPQSEFLKTLYEDCREFPVVSKCGHFAAARPDDWKALDSGTRKALMTSAIWEMLEFIGMKQPVIIILEDIHWADNELRLFLHEFANRKPAIGILIIFSSRPSAVMPWLDRIGQPVNSIELKPLNREDQENLLDEWLGSSITLSSLKRNILQVSEGNPLFLHELVSVLLTSTMLFGTSGNFICTHQELEFSLPTSLKALLDLRLRSVEKPALLCLQRASIIGPRFDRDLLLEITEADAETLDGLLQSLEKAGLILPGEELANDYRFSHALLHDAAYASLLKQDSRRIHAKIFSILRRRTGRFRMLAACAYHATRADLFPEGFLYNFLAGNQAVNRADGAKAVLHFNDAIECLSRLSDREVDKRRCLAKCNLGLAFALSIQGHHLEARQIIERTKDSLPRLNDSYLRLRAKFSSLELLDYWVQGDLIAGARTGYALLEKCQSLSDPFTYVSTAIRVAGMLQDQGLYEESNAVLLTLDGFFGLHNASERYGLLFPPATTCPAMVSRNFGELGDFAAAELWADRCRTILNHSGNMLAVIYGLSYSATWLIRAHRYQDALPALEAAYYQSGQIKTNLLYPFVASHYGFALFNTGDIEQGLQIMKESDGIARRQTANGRRSLYTQILAEARYLKQDYQAAENLALEAIGVGGKFGERANIARSYYVMAACRLAGSRHDMEDFQYLKRAESMAREMKLSPLIANCRGLRVLDAA